MPAQQRVRLRDEQRSTPAATNRARRTSRRRSAGVSTGRLTWRSRTTSWWRRNAFSASNAAFVLVRSPTVLPTHGPVAGFVHARRRRWTARSAACAQRLIAVEMVVAMCCSSNGIATAQVKLPIG